MHFAQGQVELRRLGNQLSMLGKANSLCDVGNISLQLTNRDINDSETVYFDIRVTVVPVMNGHPRDQAKVSVHCRWPLIRGNLTSKCFGRGIDNVAVQGRWPLTTGVAQGRYYCIQDHHIWSCPVSVCKIACVLPVVLPAAPPGGEKKILTPVFLRFFVRSVPLFRSLMLTPRW